MLPRKGFSLVEMLVVVAVVVIVATLSWVALLGTARAQALDKDADRVAAVLERARSLTLASSADRQYGVHFDATQAVLFGGATYNAADTLNRAEVLNSSVTISAISLAGGGSEVLFERLTGATTMFGSVTLSRSDDPTQTRTIEVFSTGLIHRR